MLRLQGYLLSALFVAISVTLAILACDAYGKTVNNPMMNVAVLVLIPAMIAAIGAALCTEESN